MHPIAATLFDACADIRYVAIYRDGVLESSQRNGLSGASASESDRFEELLVNPALLTLVRQRGEIDCGGMSYVVVRYGNFYQVVLPTGNGHVSVAVEPCGDPIHVASLVLDVLSS